MIGRRAIGAALVLVLAMAAPASGYTLIRRTAGSPPLRWPNTVVPMFQPNDQIGAGVPNVAPGSDPLTAIQRSLPKYRAVSSAPFMVGPSTPVASGGMDNVNVVSFADTAANRSVFEMAGGSAVVGLTLIFAINDDVVEADVLFNPTVQFTTLLDSDEALRGAHLIDVEAVATHELGHSIGLHHTGVVSATMWALTSILQRHLDADDIAGARTLYPLGGSMGSIAGHVTVNGVPAFGAQVVAVAASGAVAASALSLPDGTYAIEQLAPGSYRVYVEPLDGPHSAVPTDGCVRFSNLSGAGIYSRATLTTDFPTRFMDHVAVTVGQSATVDFALTGGAPPVNPVQSGAATIAGGSVSATVATAPLSVTAGTDRLIVVAGPNVDRVPIDGIDLGPDITIDPSSRQQLNATCNGLPFPFVVFHASIDRNAAPGGRSIAVTVSGETTVLTGGLRITGGRPACVGDCDGSGSVEIGELITGVNIALGNARLDVCPAFDANGDGEVAVSELIQAVNAALNGCG